MLERDDENNQAICFDFIATFCQTSSAHIEEPTKKTKHITGKKKKKKNTATYNWKEDGRRLIKKVNVVNRKKGCNTSALGLVDVVDGCEVPTDSSIGICRQEVICACSGRVGAMGV